MASLYSPQIAGNSDIITAHQMTFLYISIVFDPTDQASSIMDTIRPSRYLSWVSSDLGPGLSVGFRIMTRRLSLTGAMAMIGMFRI